MRRPAVASLWQVGLLVSQGAVTFAQLFDSGVEDAPFFTGLGGLRGGFGGDLLPPDSSKPRNSDLFPDLFASRGNSKAQGSSSSVSSETVYESDGRHPGHFLARKKRCKNGECVQETQRGEVKLPAGEAKTPQLLVGSKKEGKEEEDVSALRTDASTGLFKDAEKNMQEMRNKEFGMDSIFKRDSPFNMMGDDWFGNRARGGLKLKSKAPEEDVSEKDPSSSHEKKKKGHLHQKHHHGQLNRMLNRMMNGKMMNGKHEGMSSSSSSVETSVVNGKVVERRKECHDGKCTTTVVKRDVKPEGKINEVQDPSQETEEVHQSQSKAETKHAPSEPEPSLEGMVSM